MVSHRQLRPIYKDPQTHKTDDETCEVIDEEEDLPVRPISKANHLVFQEILANSRLLETRTTKIRQVQELVLPKISKKADSIRAMAGHERFNIRKIFDLPLEVTVGKFLDCLNTTIREIAFNTQKSTLRYRVKRPKPI